jgi:putative resolvase
VILAEWAHMQGIHVQTGYRWYREGTLPVPVQKVGRLILVCPGTATEEAGKREGAGLYPSVSSDAQRSGLDGQVARLSAWATDAGLPVARVEAGVGSGMNGLRAKVRSLFLDLGVTVVVAGHRDRLERVNTEPAAAPRPADDRRVVVPGDSEVTGDLVGDVLKLQRRGGDV